MKKKKKYFLILALLLFLSLTTISWRHITKGFRPHKILKTQEIYSIEIKNSTESENEALKILKQKFTYLNKGSQIFVFESEDGKYVIKFLALNKYKEPFYRSFLSTLNLFKSYREEKKTNKLKNYNAALSSYKVVNDYVKKETQSIYFHFTENENFSFPITLIDNTGQLYKIDPNQTLFIIQKKADNLKNKLLKFIKEDKIDNIKENISNYLSMASNLVQIGIINKDSNVKNLGILENTIIELDLGRFQKINSKNNYYNSLQKYTRLYRNFIKDNIPKLLDYFDKQIIRLKENNEKKEIFN